MITPITDTVTTLVIDAISHPRVKKKLHELNLYFYNRKHENQIRDEISIVLNENSDYLAMTEHPKKINGAVDLSIYKVNDFECNLVSTIELKHHYPKDLTVSVVQNSIISDLTRTVESKTTHFIHIIQHRSVHKKPLVSEIKYLHRDATNIANYTNILEGIDRFPLKYHKNSHSITVQSEIMTSTYTFNIYTLFN